LKYALARGEWAVALRPEEGRMRKTLYGGSRPTSTQGKIAAAQKGRRPKKNEWEDVKAGTGALSELDVATN